MRRESGFTLIELMIVIAILAIIAVIAIPSLIKWRIAEYERLAVESLKKLVTVQRIACEVDFDKNNQKDYWTRDVASLHFMQDPSGRKYEFIDSDLAYADKGGTYVTSTTAQQTVFEPKDKSGYFFQTMRTDQDGQTYQKDDDGDNYAYTNMSRWGICAFPSKYGTTGLKTFIVNETGVIYAIDAGTGTVVDAWPGADPTSATPPWTRAEE